MLLLLLLLLLGLVVPAAAVADVGQPRRAVERKRARGQVGARALAFVEHPRVLGTTAGRGVDDHRALLQGDPGQASGHDPDLIAEHRERAQVDVAGLQVPGPDLGRRGREMHELLGDPAVGVVLDHPPLLVELGGARLRPDEHALAAGLAGRLDHDLGQPAEHVVALGLVGQQIGRHVLEDRLLAQVEADHLRDVVVDRLVVGDPGSDRVGDRDGAGPVGAHQARNPEQRVGAELQRVDERVVEATVDRVHPLQARRRAHVTHGVADDEVRRLDELDAHLPGEERVLEVGGVHRAGGPEHDRRV